MFETWITDGSGSPFYARKEFQLEKQIQSASAKVCGLGQFHFFINGRKVSDHELDPAWTDYKKYIQYVTFDVKEYLQPGKNVLGAEVGNGWYIKIDEHYTFSFPPFMPSNPNPYKPYGNSLVLALELTVTYTDGTQKILTADESFRVKKHPVVMSNVYGSETINGALLQPGWCEADFCDDNWENAKLVSEQERPKGKPENQFQPPVKVIKVYDAVYLYEKDGRDIYDFGQNMSGILDLEVKGKNGDTIKIYPAEKLGENGDIDQVAKDWATVDSCITYMLGQDDMWEKCRMKFTYFAGRYVAVEKICADISADKSSLQIRNFHADAITSAYKTDGTFVCDDERYNQIYNMIERTVEANMLGVHTDCPTIERFAWQEPNHLMASSVFYMKDGNLLWKKFLEDMRYAQHTADDAFYDFAGNKFYPGDGLMPSQCPCYIPNVLPVPGMGSFYDIIAWGSTCILGTYWHYKFYGDKEIIEENFEAGMRYFKYLKTRLTEEGFINHGLGDWGNPRNDLARENIETAFLYADAVVLAELAEILNEAGLREKLLQYSEEIRRNYNERLLVWNEMEGFWCYKCWDHPEAVFMTQASQALPLFWGMVPEDKVSDVVKAFKFTLERDGAFICGEIGLPYVIQAARRSGFNDMISEFIVKEEHPSYYAFILDGETTLGEYWEKNPRSHCHDMMGHIIEWYYNGLAGIIPEKAGFAEVTIRPYLPKSMHEFSCNYNSVSGRIYVHVKETEDEISVEIKCAAGIVSHVDISNLKCRGKNIVCK